ncbi:BlaI/MecI/CopY family transcriptional regulator [bacterium]|nr:BlaI/MecI/CopY family transcriptional regulator [bacterium]
MVRPASNYPTDLELEILKVLWRDGPSVVQHVRDELAPARTLAYSSVITIMNIMTDKGYLSRAKEGKGYRYKARVKERATKRQMLADLVDRAFDGSAAAVMLNLIETKGVDPAELDQLREILKKIEE